MTDPDMALAAFLAAEDRAPDEAFVLRVSRQVEAEERLRAARRSAWRKFGMELAATGAVIAAFVLLSRLGAPGPKGAEIVPFSPAVIALILLGLWAVAALRPEATRSS